MRILRKNAFWLCMDPSYGCFRCTASSSTPFPRLASHLEHRSAVSSDCCGVRTFARAAGQTQLQGNLLCFGLSDAERSPKWVEGRRGEPAALVGHSTPRTSSRIDAFPSNLDGFHPRPPRGVVPEKKRPFVRLGSYKTTCCSTLVVVCRDFIHPPSHADKGLPATHLRAPRRSAAPRAFRRRTSR